MQKYWKSTPYTKAFDVLNHAILILFTLIVVYPLWDQFVISITDNHYQSIGSAFLWPISVTFDAYKQLFNDTNILKGAFVSLLRVGVGTVSTLFCTGLLAYITTIKRFKGRTLVRRIYIFTMYFGGGLIPFYLLMVNLHLINTFWVYVIPGLFSAYYMLLIASYIQNIPDSLFEAARIDGCSELGIYVKVVIPICIPVFAAVAVYLAVGHWNSWFDVLIYNPKGDWDTLQVYLRRILLEAESFSKIQDSARLEAAARRISGENLKAATTIAVTVPILIVYPFFQKYFISGITIGAVKE